MLIINFASYFNRQHHIGKLISISIKQPGNYEEFDLLFPTVELFYQKEFISWEEFKKQYRNILETRREKIIDVLSNREEEIITFCCWERNPYNCHRFVAFEFLKEIGYNVKLH